nr:MAG TPA_asm: hypothetical protein [Caudoviricetes sp.]
MSSPSFTMAYRNENIPRMSLTNCRKCQVDNGIKPGK